MSGVRRLAAIDIGTVTTRLLVADVSDAGIIEIARSTDITHLGEGLTATGLLCEPAMERVAQVMERYSAIAADLGVERLCAVATSASRDAGNSEEFMALLASRGVEPSVIPGAREAHLSFLGATSHMGAGTVLVDDIGGGSTELVLGSAEGPLGARVVSIDQARSIDVGSRRLTELHLLSDPPSAGQLAQARAFVTAELRPFFDTLREPPAALVSVAGTATSVVSVLEAMEPYDPDRVHGTVVSGAQVSDVLEQLAAVPIAKRRRIVGLHPERAGVIVAGVLILETVMALAGVDSTIVSEHDILYGILLDEYAGERS